MKQGTVPTLRSIRSFVIREGRFTRAQKAALETFWPQYGITIGKEKIDFDCYFVNIQPVILDVGFGNGDSLIALAQQRSDFNFIGVEVYRPGIGSALRKLHELKITNVRIVNADVLELLQHYTQSNYFQGIVVWFPDPWPKKRHHKRRLVQAEFLQQAVRVIKTNGILHLASDWLPYAEAMQATANKTNHLVKLNKKLNPLHLSRPQTRFEQRGLRLGHAVTDLLYQVKE